MRTLVLLTNIIEQMYELSRGNYSAKKERHRCSAGEDLEMRHLGFLPSGHRADWTGARLRMAI